PLLIPMRGRLIHERDGGSELLPYGQREDEVIYSVSREGLNHLLVDAAAATGRVELQFDCGVSDYDPDTGMLEWEDADGRQQRRDVGPVIATDGAGSMLRRALQSRGLITAREELLAHAYKELTIAPAADGTHRLEREALHIWPRGGFMVIALPNLDGSFTVTLFLAREGAPGFDSLSDAASVEAFFMREFGDVAPLLEDLADTFFSNPTGVLGTVYATPWQVGGKLLLLGDAAHAIVPFHGQGMNAAFEDCRLLAERLVPDVDVGAVFESFFRDHKADADAIARMALENYVEMRDTVRDPSFALRKSLGFELERRCPDRFVPRYSMVMFHHLPYAEVERRGAIQKTLLGELTRGHERLSTIDLEVAEQAVRERLAPFTQPAV
ncbi:MAG: FAD-dependent monooxygenase, partial [Gammaproteobacteria bacterium]